MDYSQNHIRDNFDSISAFMQYGRLIDLYGIYNELNDWEKGFVENLLDKVPRKFTDPQRVKIGQIYKRYFL